jgi:hypothetical protein
LGSLVGFGKPLRCELRLDRLLDFTVKSLIVGARSLDIYPRVRFIRGEIHAVCEVVARILRHRDGWQARHNAAGKKKKFDLSVRLHLVFLS